MVAIPESSLLLKAADSLLGWFGLLRNEQAARSENERRAIKDLYVALNETLLCFRRLDRPHLAGSKKERGHFKRDIRAEEYLSRAIQLRTKNKTEEVVSRGGLEPPTR